MRQDPAAERLEWIAGLLSAVIVAAIVGFLLYEAVFAANALPDLRVVTEPKVAEADRTHLRYAVTNDGGRTAAAVTLSLTISRDGALVDERTVTIDYVPAHSQVTGGVYLPADAADLQVELAVEGYVDP